MLKIKSKILIADDEVNMIWALKKALTKEGYEIISAEDGLGALDSFKKHEPDLVILDLKMPKMDGMEVLENIKNINPKIPVIMITAHGSTKLAVEAMKLGALDYISKPFDIEELRVVIRRALEYKHLNDEVNYLRGKLKEDNPKIIYQSKIMEDLLNLVYKVAPTDATVLVLAESGTGKELIANALHEYSNRSKGPLIKINCGALPENLLESELFGYEKGAFTGAVSRKKGKFELAQGGTIFLDEIGEISESMQIKLLRVLQEKEFERVGGEETIKGDFRVIAATNKDLKMMVDRNDFREDLYYRLNVIPISIPALRHRRQDIPLLIDYFIGKYSGQMGKPKMKISKVALEKMMNYEWKGNIRELQNIIERCVILSWGQEITEDILPEDIKGTLNTFDSNYILPDEGILLEDVERNLIIQALERTEFNQTKAAKLLGITRHTLIYRLEKYNIDIK
ncbi:sigma-54-dependent transcriptional regulator [Tissierella creatinophila]|uniref:Transcriptional regulatory protein ZraR n=1 Tax=Tissierella creatinophila DSM 6911 TaxID=1123403 RepID=A0A1U7M3T4_TISCR|nr:sigma-54 dependent transcriptional regulator [Tissierella creatinophila]OLS01977.1 transcriptional regulatory protein ZraR [Tissierella creatinophila DSM 6911]